jgi:alkaline phosphatase D
MTVVESWRKYRLVLPFVAILCVHGHAQNPAPVLESAHGPNAPGQEKKPYVVLVSLDGFCYDCTERYGAKNLHALATQGASAPEGMIPVYPSLSLFPIIIRS